MILYYVAMAPVLILLHVHALSMLMGMLSIEFVRLCVNKISPHHTLTDCQLPQYTIMTVLFHAAS